MPYPLKVDAEKVKDGVLFGAIIDAQVTKPVTEEDQTNGKNKTQNKVQSHYFIFNNLSILTLLLETTTEIRGSFGHSWRYVEKTQQ
jgi:hypothetical protein